MEQLELVRYAIETLEGLSIPYALVGSWGSGIYGEPRFTRDIDIVVDLAMASVAAFCAAFPNGEYYLSENAVREAVRDRFQFNVVHPASGNKIDFRFIRISRAPHVRNTGESDPNRGASQGGWGGGLTTPRSAATGASRTQPQPPSSFAERSTRTAQ